MSKVYSINSSNILAPQTKYYVVEENQLPKNYIIFPNSIREKDLEKYHVILCHRLRREIYCKPSDIEIEEIKQLDGKWSDRPRTEIFLNYRIR